MILQAVLRGTIIIALAALMATLLRHRSAALRHHVWATAVVVQLSLLVFIPVLPRLALPVIPVVRAEIAAPITDLADRSTVAADAQSAAANAVTSVTARSEAVSRSRNLLPRTPAARLTLIWLIGVAIILARFVFGTAVMARIAISGERIEDGEWLVFAQRIARELGITRPITMIWGDKVAVPITWGVLYPMILLPKSAQEWPLERRRLVLLHEMAHVKRFDAFTHLLAQVTTAIFWFSPLVWLAEWRMRIEREHACDDTVIRYGTEPARYADELLQMVRVLVRRRAPKPAFAALAMARPSEFEGRMLAILDRERPRRVTGITSGIVFAMLSVLIAAPLAAVDPFTFKVETTTKSPAVESTTKTASAQKPPKVEGQGPDAPVRPQPQQQQQQRPSAPPSDVELLDKVLGGITSNSDLARAMLTQVPHAGREALLVFGRHAAKMESAYELRQFLIAAGPHFLGKERSVVAAWFNAASNITSDYDRRVALVWAIPHVKTDPESSLAILLATRSMQSGFEKSVVLAEVARQKLITSAELRTAFLTEVATLSSGSDRRVVLEALY